MARRQDKGAAVSAALEAVPDPSNYKVNQSARRTEAVSMSLAGLTYEQIGKRLGVTSTSARNIVQRALAETRAHDVEMMRDVENARLDRAQAAIWSKVLDGDLGAIDRFMKISDRRAKLNGLDAPSRVEMSLSIRQEMEQAFAQLEEILDADVIEEGDVVEIEQRQATQRYIEAVADGR